MQTTVCDGYTLDALTLGKDRLGPAKLEAGRVSFQSSVAKHFFGAGRQ
jgi:hypothetical protein